MFNIMCINMFVYGIIILALKSSFATDVGSLPIGSYCSSLPETRTCCRSRQENCFYDHQALLGSNTAPCYCDSQCYNAVDPSETDCCDDYIEHCGSFHRLEGAIVKHWNQKNLTGLLSRLSKAMFKHATNLTPENEREKSVAQTEYSKAKKRFRNDAWSFYGGPQTGLTKHMFDVIGKTSRSHRNIDYGRAYELESIMTNTFIEGYHAGTKPKDRTASEWQEFSDNVGRANREPFLELINIYNNSNVDMTKDWYAGYLMPDDEFKSMLTDIYNEILPLYESLFTFIRRKYREKNAHDTKLQTTKTTYQHFWHTKALRLLDLGLEDGLNVTQFLVKQNYTPVKMARLAESFYKSLNLGELSDYFWEHSMLERPSDGRQVTCERIAYDFFYEGQYAIQVCPEVNALGYYVMFHEMGHIYYYKQFASQPVFFKHGANPAFHEAIGDAMHLSAVTPAFLKHAEVINSSVEESKDMLVDRLLRMALSDGVGFRKKLEFYLIDLYRWNLFDGSILENNLNSGYWDLSYKYLGITPEVDRVEGLDFDPGAIHGVVINIPTSRYLLSLILSFQIHESLCKAAGDTSEYLAQCSVHGSDEAGKLLVDLLEPGKSAPWRELMKTLLGNDNISASSLVKYFKPLMDWLDDENTKANDCYGWGYEQPENLNLKTPRC